MPSEEVDAPMSGTAKGTVAVPRPLALASIDELIDELANRAGACIAAMVNNDKSMSFFTSGDESSVGHLYYRLAPFFDKPDQASVDVDVDVAVEKNDKIPS